MFGSNLAGRHGKGSALLAKRVFGAIQGIGVGRQGQSYAIPTKDENLNVLPLSAIKVYVKEFLQYAGSHPELKFIVVAIGCGLAGYTPKDIAPMFSGIPLNVKLPREFEEVLSGN